MSLVAVLAVVCGLKLTAQDGFDGLAGAAILGGLVVGLLFVRRQLTLADPMIDLQLFQNTAFNAALATNLAGIFIAVGCFCSSPSTSSWCWGCRRWRRLVVAAVSGRVHRRVECGSPDPAPAPSRAADRHRPRHGGHWPGHPHPGRRVPQRRPGHPGRRLPGRLAGAGPGVHGHDGPDRQLGPARAGGAASGISEIGAELGGALGIAILGSVGVAAYRGELAEAVSADLPAQAAAAARDTLGGAVGWPRSSRASSAGPWSPPPREAFIQGLQLTAALSAAVAIVVLATALLRHVPAGPQAKTAEQPAPAAEPAPFILPQDTFQVIRSGSGCMACPGERRLEEVHDGDHRPHREGRIRS